MTLRDSEKINHLSVLCDHAQADARVISGHLAGTDKILTDEVAYHFQAAAALLDEIKARNAK